MALILRVEAVILVDRKAMEHLIEMITKNIIGTYSAENVKCIKIEVEGYD